VRRQVATRNAQGGIRQPVVLVVEDEALLRSITGEHLRLCGYAVDEAADAAEAIALIGRGEWPDLVFSDVSLPGRMDGLSLARWLRRWRPDLRVLLTSGYGEAVYRAAIELVGSECFLRKPYRQEELVQRIDNLLASEQSPAG
jgi:CheY-like chemotaxis protein